MIYTGSDGLLPQHQHLLLEDPVVLGEGSLTDKQVWISRMEVAILTKEKVDKTTASTGNQPYQEEETIMDKRTTRLKGHAQE